MLSETSAISEAGIRVDFGSQKPDQLTFTFSANFQIKYPKDFLRYIQIHTLLMQRHKKETGVPD